MGSLPAWRQTGAARFGKRWLGEEPGSDDSLGRIAAAMDADRLRQAMHRVYERLKRNKALPDIHGLAVAVWDGHESSASYLRFCPGCLERTIHPPEGDRRQF